MGDWLAVLITGTWSLSLFVWIFCIFAWILCTFATFEFVSVWNLCIFFCKFAWIRVYLHEFGFFLYAFCVCLYVCFVYLYGFGCVLVASDAVCVRMIA